MPKQTTHRELYDPFSHYVRGVLLSERETFRFVAYRMPYQSLNDKTWDSEQAFMADYRRTVEMKNSHLLRASGG